MPSASPVVASLVVLQNGMGERGRRCVTEFRIDHDVDTVARKNFECTCECGLGKRMCILCQEEGTVSADFPAELGNRLRDREDMVLVKRIGK